MDLGLVFISNKRTLAHTWFKVPASTKQQTTNTITLFSLAHKIYPRICSENSMPSQSVYLMPRLGLWGSRFSLLSIIRITRKKQQLFWFSARLKTLQSLQGQTINILVGWTNKRPGLFLLLSLTWLIPHISDGSKARPAQKSLSHFFWLGSPHSPPTSHLLLGCSLLRNLPLRGNPNNFPLLS